jgi:hypothetical protein
METLFITATLLAGKGFFRYSYMRCPRSPLSVPTPSWRDARNTAEDRSREDFRIAAGACREVRLRDTQAPTPFLELLAKSAAPYSYLPDAECSP